MHNFKNPFISAAETETAVAIKVYNLNYSFNRHAICTWLYNPIVLTWFGLRVSAGRDARDKLVLRSCIQEMRSLPSRPRVREVRGKCAAPSLHQVPRRRQRVSWAGDPRYSFLCQLIKGWTRAIYLVTLSHGRLRLFVFVCRATIKAQIAFTFYSVDAIKYRALKDGV